MLAASFVAILVVGALLGALVWVVAILALAYLLSLARVTPGAIVRACVGIAAGIVVYIVTAALIALPLRV